ncbi:MAG TPA: Vms1/Ankzf1 family peptidyl-tRNA hydrolase [Pseudonocardia sp.]|nr:Vms1/Ankzf1 family peptidyl-tRNA hydrolase [Pseudonocardia sp.]
MTEIDTPYATVYLDATHDTEDAEHALRLRWAEARGELERQGADAGTLDALEAAVTGGERAVGRAGRVLVARGGEVLLDRALPEPPARTVATWSPVPELLPMLLDETEPLTAVVVRVDKAGGEIYLTDAGDRGAGAEQVETVKGDDHPLHKVRSGGWKHLKMQHTVENTWSENVGDVAARVDVQVSATGARLVVLAGEAQSRTLLREALGERAAKVAVEVEHSGLRAGGSLDELEDAVEDAARRAVSAERHAVLERYDQAAGRPDGLAVHGIGPVLGALRAEAVDVLLLDGGVEREAQVWVGKEPAHVAADPEELRAMGAEPVARVPVDAALLRAAAGSAARFEPIGGGRTGLVGRPVTDGVAALLRYPLGAGA